MFKHFCGWSIGWSLLLGANVQGQDLIYIDPNPKTGTSSAVVVADSLPLIHTGSFIAEDIKGDDMLDVAFQQLEDTLKAAGSSLDRVVKLNFTAGNKDRIEKYLAQRFAGKHKPAVSYFVNGAPSRVVGVDAFAVDAVAVGARRESWKLVEHGTSGLGSRYSIMAPGTRIYVSGQAVDGKDLAESTRKTLEELRDTLKFLGLTESSIVQLKTFFGDVKDYETVSKEVKRFFGDKAVPPLIMVEWKSSVPIEIELIAWGGKLRYGVPIEYMTPPGMKASPNYSRVARVNDGKLIYLSSFYGAKDNDPAAEITDIFEQMGKVLEKAGSDYRHLAKATYYVTSAEATKKMGELRPKYYDPKRPPAASLAMVPGTGKAGKTVTMDMIALPSPTLKVNEYGPAQRGYFISEKRSDEGWIALFDGHSTFGWDRTTAKNSQLGEGKSNVAFGNGELIFESENKGKITWGRKTIAIPANTRAGMTLDDNDPSRIELSDRVSLSSLLFKPKDLKTILHNDLTGWKAIHHPKLPADRQATWTIKDGILTAIGGPGCLEYTEKQFANFVLQLEVRTKTRHTNSGVFFRAIPGDFMNGYEAQIYNRCHDDDVTKPWTWATGAIDHRQNARRLVSRDGEWFTYTIIAVDNRIGTWVNGYQTVDLLDERKEDDNPRLGRRTKAGAIQLQAHDEATEVEFRNIRIAEWK